LALDHTQLSTYVSVVNAIVGACLHGHVFMHAHTHMKRERKRERVEIVTIYIFHLMPKNINNANNTSRYLTRNNLYMGKYQYAKHETI
jgi:hypothetical protein